MKKGKLLVFEGVDGSGKTTQIDLLSKWLEKQKIPFETVSFPQYGKNKYADEIYDYLSGKLGKLKDIDPHTIAKIYASDRKTVRDEIKRWLEMGKLVIANRYISSSKAHMGANLDKEKKEEFIKWIDELEYEKNDMPREDITVLLSVDPRVGQKNSQEKNHPDIHEDNLAHLKKANKIFLDLAKKNPNWYVIDCMSGASMKNPKEIHREVGRVITKN